MFCTAGVADEPDATVDSPAVSGVSGALVICGGGRLPEQLPQRFLDLAGGGEARIVIVTTASRYADSPAIERSLSFWRAQRVASLDVLHTSSREVADSDAFSEPLAGATGVWFVGGDQNKVTRAYLGTKTQRRLHELLDRGGVIGGTSAGAAIMSQVMIAGGRSEPRLSPGLGFLSGAIVDQHFLKRRRQDRLVKAVCARPGHIGLGIDEGTAIVVQGTTLRVLGESEVCVCRPADSPAAVPKIETLKPGEQADLEDLCAGVVRPVLATASSAGGE
jgi:cyanophycinase